MRELIIRLGELLEVAPIALAAAVLAWWPLVTYRSLRCGTRFARRTSAVDIAMVLTGVQVIYLVAAPVRFGRGPRIDLIPFREIAWTLNGPGPALQVAGNLLLLLPLFALAPLRSSRLNSLPAVIVAAVLVSTTIETGQYLLHVGRVSAVDDIILNVLGAVIGALLTRPLWQSLTEEVIARRTWWETYPPTPAEPQHN